MTARLNANVIAPEAYKAMAGLQAYVDGCSLDKRLVELVKVRASQINGCAFCIAMHTADAVKLGETHARLHLLAAWSETTLFDAREAAALAWTEAVTLVASSHVPDDVYAAARAVFSERELVDLTYAVMAINAWNRLAISFRKQPVVAAG